MAQEKPKTTRPDDPTDIDRIMIFDGTVIAPGYKITVSDTEPVSPSTGDIWIEIT